MAKISFVEILIFFICVVSNLSWIDADDKIEDFPYVVIIKLKSGYFFTGSLIRLDKVICTAALFLANSYDTIAFPDVYKNATVLAGVLSPENMTDAEELVHVRNVVRVRISSHYHMRIKAVAQSNLATAFLNKPFVKSSSIGIIKYQDPDKYEASWESIKDKDCFFVGLQNYNIKNDEKLKKRQLTKMKECYNWKEGDLKREAYGCFKPEGDGKFCAGDGGAPLVCKGELYGLLGNVPELCLKEDTLFQLLSHDLDFINASTTFSSDYIWVLTLIYILTNKIIH